MISTRTPYWKYFQYLDYLADVLKSARLGNVEVLLRSPDGRNWFARPADVLGYRRRQERTRVYLRERLLTLFFGTELQSKKPVEARWPHFETFEQELWFTVLWQAVADLEPSEKPVIKHAARRWIESHLYSPGSFLWICDHLELNAERLRRRIFERAGIAAGELMSVSSIAVPSSHVQRPVIFRMLRSSGDVKERCYNIRDLAERWECAEQTVKGMIETGELKAVKIGSSWRVKPEEVLRAEERSAETALRMAPQSSGAVSFPDRSRPDTFPPEAQIVNTIRNLPVGHEKRVLRHTDQLIVLELLDVTRPGRSRLYFDNNPIPVEAPGQRRARRPARSGM